MSQLPEAIICDLDGTLALLNGRNPYDASKCERDLLNSPVARILQCFTNEVTIILVSGRMDEHREQTENWLERYHIRYDLLLMRMTDDTRPDTVIKKEIYRTYIKGKYNVLFVLDDRTRVVNMWRNLGLTCLQVAPGDF